MFYGIAIIMYHRPGCSHNSSFRLYSLVCQSIQFQYGCLCTRSIGEFVTTANIFHRLVFKITAIWGYSSVFPRYIIPLPNGDAYIMFVRTVRGAVVRANVDCHWKSIFYVSCLLRFLGVCILYH